MTESTPHAASHETKSDELKTDTKLETKTGSHLETKPVEKTLETSSTSTPAHPAPALSHPTQTEAKTTRDQAEHDQATRVDAKMRERLTGDQRTDIELQTEKEKSGKPSVKIYRFAADLLEQASKRPRDVIETEVQIAVNNETQCALLRSIVAHLDGNIPPAYEPKDRIYSDAYEQAHPKSYHRPSLDPKNQELQRKLEREQNTETVNAENLKKESAKTSLVGEKQAPVKK